jgi:hypothetical protein
MVTFTKEEGLKSALGNPNSPIAKKMAKINAFNDFLKQLISIKSDENAQEAMNSLKNFVTDEEYNKIMGLLESENVDRTSADSISNTLDAMAKILGLNTAKHINDKDALVSALKIIAEDEINNDGEVSGGSTTTTENTSDTSTINVEPVVETNTTTVALNSTVIADTNTNDTSTIIVESVVITLDFAQLKANNCNTASKKLKSKTARFGPNTIKVCDLLNKQLECLKNQEETECTYTTSEQNALNAINSATDPVEPTGKYYNKFSDSFSELA